MSDSRATQADAELILKLYDFRREAVMREARKYVFDFAPHSIDDVMAVLGDFSSKENAYMRQVFGYWGMAASLVLRGALNEDLARDNFSELLFVYAKFEPFLAEIRKRTGMDVFGANMQKFVESSREARERVAKFQQRFAAQAAEAAKMGV
ncbi:MAG TPA: hypothetical protein VKG65_11790 [Terriglobales bacterium]|nr:hypothetical protein [Terriglobales bacterium]